MSDTQHNVWFWICIVTCAILTVLGWAEGKGYVKFWPQPIVSLVFCYALVMLAEGAK